jgi:hypothetical protein
VESSVLALPAQGGVTLSVEAALAEPLIPGAETSEAVIRLNDRAGMDFLARAPSGHELILDTDPVAMSGASIRRRRCWWRGPPARGWM